MSDLNSVCMVGRLTRDPELKYSSSGKAYCKWSLAINASKDKVCFIDCTAFDKTAELAGEHLRKGKAVSLQGRLALNRWTDKDGTNHSKHEILVNVINFLSGQDNYMKPVNEPDKASEACTTGTQETEAESKPVPESEPNPPGIVTAEQAQDNLDIAKAHKATRDKVDSLYFTHKPRTSKESQDIKGTVGLTSGKPVINDDDIPF